MPSLCQTFHFALSNFSWREHGPRVPAVAELHPRPSDLHYNNHERLCQRNVLQLYLRVCVQTLTLVVLSPIIRYK